MKIVLTGGGSGGHFYPLIAVVEALEKISLEKKLVEPEWYYTGPAPFDPATLPEHNIIHLPSPAGKIRRYPSMFNLIDIFKTCWGVVRSTIQLFGLFPDVVFSTGGFAAFPTLCAARLLGIPVVIYDADSKPGRVSLWAGRFARWIALGHPDAAALFPKNVSDRIARTGHPIRSEIEMPAKEGGHEFLHLDATAPTVFILGGSQGARAINEVVLDSLPTLVERCNVILQAGAAHLQEVTGISGVALKDSRHADRYRGFGLLNTLALRMAAGIADIIVSRAGNGTIFEIASWGVPAILVPIPQDVSHDQIENAFSYARAGACVVIEQENLSPHVLIAEIDRLLADAPLRAKMRDAARVFSRPDAAKKIAQIIIETGLEHTA